MQIELDYITEKLHAIDINLEDVSRGLTPSGYLTINQYLDDMRYQLSELSTEINNLEITSWIIVIPMTLIRINLDSMSMTC